MRKHMDNITMEIGGKERAFIFDMNAFAELEKRYGSVDLGISMLQSGQIGSVKKMLWLACIHDEVKEFDEDGEPISYNITPYDCGKWINFGMLAEVSEKLGKAMTIGMPEQQVAELIETVDPNAATIIYTEKELRENEKNV